MVALRIRNPACSMRRSGRMAERNVHTASANLSEIPRNSLRNPETFLKSVRSYERAARKECAPSLKSSCLIEASRGDSPDAAAFMVSDCAFFNLFACRHKTRRNNLNRICRKNSRRESIVELLEPKRLLSATSINTGTVVHGALNPTSPPMLSNIRNSALVYSGTSPVAVTSTMTISDGGSPNLAKLAPLCALSVATRMDRTRCYSRIRRQSRGRGTQVRER